MNTIIIVTSITIFITSIIVMTIPITIRRDLTGGFEPAQTFLGATQQLFSPTWPAAIILNVKKCDEAMDIATVAMSVSH